MPSSRRSASAPASEHNLSGTLVYNPLGTSERTREDQLLHEAMQEELAKRALERMSRDCTFRPQINHHQQHAPRSGSNDTNQGGAGSDSGDVVERLLKKGELARKALEDKLKAKMEQEELARRSAFRPIVNTSDPYKAGLMHPPDLPVEERLLHYGKTVEESRKKLKEDREALERKQLLEFFRPSTIARDSNKKQKSFLTREETKKNDRDKEIGEARQQLMKEYTFQPSISKISEQLASKGRTADPAQRAAALYDEALRRRQDREQKQREAAAMESDRSAYHPATNPTSVEWIAHGQHRNLFEADFVQRQEEYAKVHAEHEKQLHEAVRSEAGGSRRSRSDAGSPPMRVHHRQIERQVDDLYNKSREISAEAKKRLQERLIKEECPFKPTVSVGTNAVMERIHREKDPVKRLTMQVRRSFSADSRHRLEEQQAAAVSAINESTGSHQRQVDPAEATEFYHRQLESLARKYEILHQKHAAAEMEKQLDCTFRPKTNVDEYRRKKQKLDQSVQSDSVSSVQGADSFVRRQQIAREKQREQEMRIQQLGKGMSCNGPNYTVVVPFQLSEGRSKPKIISRRGAVNTSHQQSDSEMLIAAAHRRAGLGSYPHYHFDPNDIAR